MKRVFSLFLCIVMFVSMFPMQAKATETEPAVAWENAANCISEGGKQLVAGANANFEKYNLNPADIGDHTYRENESNNSPYYADALHHDYTVAGTLSGSDVDFFAFRLTSRSKVTITAVADYSSFGMLVTDYDVEVTYGSTTNGTRLSGGGYGYALSGELSAGTYYLAILDMNKSSNTYMFYFEAEPVATKLATPTVKLTNSTTSGKIKLSWNSISGASKYAVYRSTTKSGGYEVIDYTTSTSYADHDASIGKRYYYKVKAIHSNSAYNSTASSAVGGYYKLATPKAEAAASASTGRVKITWGKVSGAKQYAVYRSTTKSGGYEVIAKTTSTSYVDASAKIGKKYYYKIKALHTTEKANSVASSAVSATRKLGRPTVAIALKSGNPKLSWEAISGATRYVIYRATSSSGDYEKYATVTTTSYVDKAVESGVTYYYKVKASNGSSAATSSASSAKYIKAK